MDWMIAIENPNSDAPVFEGPLDEPVWGLYSNEVPGGCFGEWKMTRLADGVEYNYALALARNLGYAGSPIGG